MSVSHKEVTYVNSAIPHECTKRCSSRKHGSSLTSALTLNNNSIGDERLAAYLKWACVRYPQALDLCGRSLVHMAATKGRWGLIKWLIGHKDVNINCKDQESGYTPLHRSLFYGQVHCAVRLIEHGANLQLTDADDLTAIDHVMKDRPNYVDYTLSSPCEVYVWGTNTNYTLGVGSHHSRPHPEPVDLFRRQGTIIKQVEMNKFHSVFVSTDGRVWACGHGPGGRLGLDDEATTLVPKVIKIGNHSNVEHCVKASIGRDHSVLLMENGSVWSFGSNQYHQLGHNPPPVKLLYPKPIASLRYVPNIIGICASRFHTTVWTKSQVFSCGLHGGQLGHLKSTETTFPVLKPVSTLQFKDAFIEHVAVSDGSTVVVTNKGDVYVLHEYQCRKVTPRNRQFDIKKVCVVGGHLDHRVDKTCLREKGGEDLKMLLLTKSGKIFIWQENTLYFTRCTFPLKRQIHITDVSLNASAILLSTRDGEAFYGELRVRKLRKAVVETEKAPPKSVFHEFLDKDDCEFAKIKRVPNIHRAVSVTSDLKGRNFAVVQTHPKAALFEVPMVETSEMRQHFKTLLETTNEFDPIHDVIFEVNNRKFPAHRYIVSHASSKLEDLISSQSEKDETPVVKIENVDPQIFQQIVDFIYTGDCGLLHIGISPVLLSQETSFNEKQVITEPAVDSQMDASKISAFKYETKRKLSNKSKKRVLTSTELNPIKLIRDAAKRFQLSELLKKLELVRYENGYIFNTKEESFQPDNLKFDRKRLQNFWDVILKSDDGVEIKAHKCVLVARLEYFNSMMNQGWIESSQKSALSFPVPGNILEILIRYLYTDEAPEIVNTDDPDVASHTLVISDQLFCTRLKEYAECALSSLLSLKNAPEILQLAITYNADQLKRCTMQFICLNLASILETRSLEILSDNVLQELTKFYKSWLPCMSRRNITPYSTAPDISFIESIYNDSPITFDDVIEETLSQNIKNKTTRKRNKEGRKSNADSEGKKRNHSVGSTTSEDDLDNSFEDKLDNSKKEDNEDEEGSWVQVSNQPTKHQKVLQSRLKVITTDILPLKSDFIKLTTYSVLTTALKESSVNDSVNNDNNNGADIQTLEKNFPTLTNTPSFDRTVSSHYPKSSPTDSGKRFKKISQKQQKRLSFENQISTSDGNIVKSNVILKNVWGNRSCDVKEVSLDDIIQETISSDRSQPISIKRHQSQSQAETNAHAYSSSPSAVWCGTSSPDNSLFAIMAAEKEQKDKLFKMKAKPLELTQLEDRAIQDLLVFYNAEGVTDERITVKRVDHILSAPPVWVSSHR